MLLLYSSLFLFVLQNFLPLLCQLLFSWLLVHFISLCCQTIIKFFSFLNFCLVLICYFSRTCSISFSISFPPFNNLLSLILSVRYLEQVLRNYLLCTYQPQGGWKFQLLGERFMSFGSSEIFFLLHQ